jgi:hypothetical protein
MVGIFPTIEDILKRLQKLEEAVFPVEVKTEIIEENKEEEDTNE